MRISKAAARFTTSRPTLPSPTIPSVFPRSSVPRNFRFSHLPDLVDALARGMERASDSISARVCSATDAALPPGVFIRSEEHTSELQSRRDLVCRLLLEKKKPPPPTPP